MTSIPLLSSFNQSTNPCPEWVLLDLQGDISWKNPPSANPTIKQVLNHETLEQSITQWGGLQLGQLSIKQSSQAIYFQIGNQLMEGKLVALKKPLVIMKRSRDCQPVNQPINEAMSDESSSETSNDSPALHVQAVIRYRVSMVTRPKPLVVSVPGPMPDLSHT